MPLTVDARRDQQSKMIQRSGVQIPCFRNGSFRPNIHLFHGFDSFISVSFSQETKPVRQNLTKKQVVYTYKVYELK